MANPYHDEEGKFCSRDEMKGAIARLREKAVKVAVQAGSFTTEYETTMKQANELEKEFDSIEIEKDKETNMELEFQRRLARANKTAKYYDFRDLLNHAKDNSDVQEILRETSLLDDEGNSLKDDERNRVFLGLLKVKGLDNDYLLNRIWTASGFDKKLPIDRNSMSAIDFSDSLAEYANKETQTFVVNKLNEQSDDFNAQYCASRLLAQSEEFTPEEKVELLGTDPNHIGLTVLATEHSRSFAKEAVEETYILSKPELRDALYAQAENSYKIIKDAADDEDKDKAQLWLRNNSTYNSLRFIAGYYADEKTLRDGFDKGYLHPNNLAYNKNLPVALVKDVATVSINNLKNSQLPAVYRKTNQDPFRAMQSLVANGKIKKIEPVFNKDKERAVELNEEIAKLKAELDSLEVGRYPGDRRRSIPPKNREQAVLIQEQIYSNELELATFTSYRKKLETKLKRLEEKPEPKTSGARDKLSTERSHVRALLTHGSNLQLIRQYSNTPVDDLIVK